MARNNELEQVKRLWSKHVPDAGATVTPAFRKWVDGKVVSHKAYMSGRKAWCTHCGSSFVPEDEGAARCPVCGRRLEVVRSRKIKYCDYGYLQEVTAWDKYQVIRLYLFKINCRKDERCSLGVYHVYDWMLSSDGNKYCFSRSIGMYPYWRKIPWSLNSYGNPELRFRRTVDGGNYEWHSGWHIAAHYPVRRVQPWLEKYWVSGEWEHMDMYDVIKTLMSDRTNHFETVWKLRNHPLCNFMLYFDGSRLWPQIKIALRAGFKFEDCNMWRDHVEMLEMEGFDILNPKFIAPADLATAHAELNEIAKRRREKREREEAIRRRQCEEERQLALKDRNSKLNRQYFARFGNLLAVAVTSGDISIAPLQNIKDFYDEGKALHHCVYENHYYDHDNALILGARVAGKRTETIELDTRNFRIVQCRGKFNQNSPRHKEIYELMERAIPQYRRAFARRHI